MLWNMNFLEEGRAPAIPDPCFGFGRKVCALRVPVLVPFSSGHSFASRGEEMVKEKTEEQTGEWDQEKGALHDPMFCGRLCRRE
jgi:hypothetical protein